MNIVKYFCDQNNYSADKLYLIRGHIQRLCPADRMQFHGDAIYRTVNGVTDVRWYRTINIVHGKVLFRRGIYPFVQ